MNNDQEARCHEIIHTAAAATGAIGAGLAQVPGADYVAIVPIQLAMIEGLGTVFGIHIGEATAKSLLASFVATVGGRAISQWLVGWIPGIGNIVNASTAFALTETIGWVAAKDFDGRAKNIKYLEQSLTQKQIEASNDFLNQYNTSFTDLVKNNKKVNETEMTCIFTPGNKKAITEITSFINSSGDKHPELIIYDSDRNTKRVKLNKNNIIIGRTNNEVKDVDINLEPFDTGKTVSRRHGLIALKSGQYYLKDTESSNGIFVNKEKIEANKFILLKDGDEIHFGKTKTMFSL